MKKLILLLLLPAFSFAQNGDTIALKKGATLPHELMVYNPFAWLEGEWTRETKEGIAIERWTILEDGSMEGVGSTLTGGEERTFERLWIKKLGDTFVYIAQPGTNHPVLFTLIGNVGGLFTFENREHDFPQQILYEKGKDGIMTAITKGPGKNGQEQQYKFHFTRKQ